MSTVSHMKSTVHCLHQEFSLVAIGSAGCTCGNDLAWITRLQLVTHVSGND